jgi:uncharacterized protein (DUF2236 family)
MSAVMPPEASWQELVPGPETVTWRRASDVRLLISAGYALLLQVSHPTVGAGVTEHSQFRREPWPRLLRTLDYTYTMVYGGPLAAGEMGQRLRNFHKRIRGVTPDGRAYHALEPQAYAWVHATLAEAIVRAHEHFGRPLTPAQREQFWSEWRTLGRLLGIRERDLPAGWSGFEAYVQGTVDTELVHTQAVDEVITALAHPRAPDLPRLPGPVWALIGMPLGHLLELATVGLLTPALRERFGLGWSRGQERELRALGTTLRAATPLMPPWLRNSGERYLGWRAEAIARGDVASPERLTAQASPAPRPRTPAL